jgi:hypothetical protein
MQYLSNNESSGRIIDMTNHNGRINILEPPSPNAALMMQERLAVNNKSTEYREALIGTWEDSVLSTLYFSAENIQILQNGLRAGVYAMSGNQFIIAPQNQDTLKIIMRSVYLQHAEHKPDGITEQILCLNKIVLDYCIPSVFNEAVGYQKYRLDQSTLVVPLVHPQHHDRQYKQLELKRWF